MAKKKFFLALQSVLCVITAIMLIIAALSIFFEGVAIRVDNPMAEIYTVEGIVKRVVPVIPIIVAAVAVTIISSFLKIRDDAADRPVMNIDIQKNTSDRMPATDKLKKIRLLVFVAAIICIVVGFYNGSMMDVFIKASKICTECIGLG